MRNLGVELGLRFTIEDSWGGDPTTAAVSHLAASTPPAALLMASFMNPSRCSARDRERTDEAADP